MKPFINILKDENHVRYLAETAKPATECEWIKFYNYHDFKDDFELAMAIRHDIGQGNACVVKGYTFQSVALNADSLWRNLRIPPNRIMIVSGKFHIFFAISKFE